MSIKSGNKVLFSKNEIINAVKSYGEIVEIKNVFWRDTSREINIPTGGVDVRILAKKQLPSTLDIGGETFKIRHLSNNQHADEVMNALWNNLKLNKEIDYKYKLFKLVEKQMGCGLVCKFTQSFADLPTHKDVYEWLTKESGLSEDYLVKIVAFKKISDTEYKIIFDDTVNCLLALAEMDTRRVVDSFDIGYEIEVNCLKGKFIDVMLASKNADGILLRKDTEDALMVYGPMTEFERLNVSNFCCGKVKCDVKCKLFKLQELPDTLEVKGVKYDVVEIDCEQDGQKEETLIRIWEELKIYE